MTLLIVYIATALVFSFMCSIAEAVLLSVTRAHIGVLEQQGHKSGWLLARLKADINKPLAAILTLNTIAHTVGAVGAGAQASILFGNEWIGIFSALLTLAILVLSEIIPKTLGAAYWRTLAGITAYSLDILVRLMAPFVWLSELITRGIGRGEKPEGFSREEFSAMAELGKREGQLMERESSILRNMFLLRKTSVVDAMTPRMVVFSLSRSLTVGDYCNRYLDSRFSRIPIYDDDKDRLVGFVLKDDLLLAQARGNTEKILDNYRRELPALADTTLLSDAFEQMLDRRAHIMMIIDEYGGLQGIITMEDILETLLGLEIMDESDRHEDMQRYAKQMWRKRAAKMGIELSAEVPPED